MCKVNKERCSSEEKYCRTVEFRLYQKHWGIQNGRQVEATVEVHGERKVADLDVLENIPLPHGGGQRLPDQHDCIQEKQHSIRTSYHLSSSSVRRDSNRKSRADSPENVIVKTQKEWSSE